MLRSGKRRRKRKRGRLGSTPVGNCYQSVHKSLIVLCDGVEN